MTLGVTKRHSDPARAEARRNQILDAAENCFQQHGFHGASMSEISHAAGMSAGHIYNYFKSKEAIIAAIAQRYVEEFLQELDKDTGERLLPRLQELARRKIDDSAVNCNAAMMFEVMAEAARNPKMGESLRGMDLQFRERLMRLCRSANAAWSDDELRVRVDVFLGLLNVYALRSICNQDVDKELFSQLVCRIIETIFDGKP